MATAEELFTALVRLREAARATMGRDLAVERESWRVVDRFLRQNRAALGTEGEDAVQDALLSIALHVGELDARDVASATAWAVRILRHKKIDLARLRTRDVERIEDHGVDDVPGIVGHHVDDHALARLIAMVEDAISARVDALPSSNAAERLLKKTQARATLHRVLGASRIELRDALALDATVGDDRLHKWVERGRPLLVAALEGLAWDHEGDARAVLFALRDDALARRVDAGRARPSRRKKKEGGEP